MSEQSPVPGDLLISRRTTDGPYEISIVPGRPQLAVAQQHDAVRQAHAFAARSGAAVWIMDGGVYVRVKPPRRES